MVCADPARAEVMDKEPGLAWLWGAALLMVAFAVAISRRLPWLIVALWLIAVLVAYAVHIELSDSHAGPAILREAARSYLLQAYVAVGLPVIALPLVAWLGLRRHGSPSEH